MNWLSDDAISRLQAASALPDLAGTRYRLIQRIGSGGMSAVYLAEDAILERRVALKILDLPDPSVTWPRACFAKPISSLASSIPASSPSTTLALSPTAASTTP